MEDILDSELIPYKAPPPPTKKYLRGLIALELIFCFWCIYIYNHLLTIIDGLEESAYTLRILRSVISWPYGFFLFAGIWLLINLHLLIRGPHRIHWVAKLSLYFFFITQLPEFYKFVFVGLALLYYLPPIRLPHNLSSDKVTLASALAIGLALVWSLIELFFFKGI